MRSLIKAGIGRRTDRLASSPYRRQMKRQLNGSQKGKPYGQRSASECVNSMIKRNLGDHLRAKFPHRRQLEQLLRTLTHNLMIIRRQRRVETEPDGSNCCRPIWWIVLFTQFTGSRRAPSAVGSNSWTP